MKHLKLFNELNLSSMYDTDAASGDIIDDINDICLELNDLNFNIKVYRMLDKVTWCIIIKLTDENDETDKYFDFSEVSEVVDRLREYLGKRLGDIHIGKVDEDDDLQWVDIMDIVYQIGYREYFMNNIYSVKIDFKL